MLLAIIFFEKFKISLNIVLIYGYLLNRLALSIKCQSQALIFMKGGKDLNVGQIFCKSIFLEKGGIVK